MVMVHACSSLARGMRSKQRRQGGRRTLPRRLCSRCRGRRLLQAGCGCGTPGRLGRFGRLRMRPPLLPGASCVAARARRHRHARGLRAGSTVPVAAPRLRVTIRTDCTGLAAEARVSARRAWRSAHA